MLFGCSLTVERLWLSCRPYHCWISEWVIWLHLFLVGTARLHEYLINHTLSTLRRRIAWFKSNQVDEGWEVNEWIRNDNQKPSWSDSVWCWSETLGYSRSVVWLSQKPNGFRLSHRGVCGGSRQNTNWMGGTRVNLTKIPTNSIKIRENVRKWKFYRNLIKYRCILNW